MWPEPWQEIQEFLSESEVSEPDLHRWIPYMRPRAMHPGDLQELVEQYRNMTATSFWATQLDLIPGWGESSAVLGKCHGYPWINTLKNTMVTPLINPLTTRAILQVQANCFQI